MLNNLLLYNKEQLKQPGILLRNTSNHREIINSFNQSIWTPYVDNVVNRTTTTPFPGVFSLPRTEVYTNTIL
jgi:hypothetical protein